MLTHKQPDPYGHTIQQPAQPNYRKAFALGVSIAVLLMVSALMVVTG